MEGLMTLIAIMWHVLHHYLVQVEGETHQGMSTVSRANIKYLCILGLRVAREVVHLVTCLVLFLLQLHWSLQCLYFLLSTCYFVERWYLNFATMPIMRVELL